MTDHPTCRVCGEDVIGSEFLCVESWQFVGAGPPDEQPVWVMEDEHEADDEHPVAEFLHSHCAPLFIEMQFAALRKEIAKDGE